MLSLLLPVIYLSFIGLGLPDSLLGAAWPVMYPQFGVPVSSSGIIFFIISAGTVVSSLMSSRLTGRLGAGKVTAISVGMTAAALFGFSISGSFWMLCLWAVPYGLGAGSVDAALNNYVALHYASRHMSWLHCMWGIGASVGPYIMGAALTGGRGWHMGYRTISLIQMGLTALILISLPLWKKSPGSGGDEKDGQRTLTLGQTVRIPGVKAAMATFFCYCTVEQTAGLWMSSYLAIHKGIAPETAARFAGLFYLGITAGRALCGFLTIKLTDVQMIRLGLGIAAAGSAVLLMPLGETAALLGLILIGLGCAPVFPGMIHATPDHFGAERSQAVIGVQMSSAYVGIALMPPLFGVLANRIAMSLFPFFLLVFLVLMVWAHESLVRITAGEHQRGQDA